VLFLDDNPWKHWAVLPGCYSGMLQMNSDVALAMVGSKGVDDMILFLAIDNFQFGMRFLLLSRMGFKNCPKLFSFLLEKQLSNICSPLPAQAAALGPKTAMRIMQALMVIFEGETLTSNLLWIAVYFLQWGTILKHELAWFIVPQKSYMMIGIFCAFDFIQDLLAGRIAEKFCSWSYVYSGKGWFHRRFFFQRLHLYYIWTSIMLNWGSGPIRSSIISLNKASNFFVKLNWHPVEAQMTIC